jgi:uncharacterized membrane protein YdbT with pleckstrin-like domain
MGYIENTLMADEDVVCVTRLHPIVLLMPAMWTSFLGGCLTMVEDTPLLFYIAAAFFVVAVYRFLDRLLYYLTSEFGVSSKRVLGKTGFIRRKSLDIVLAKVEAIRLNQNILGRLFNFGHVEVTGTGGTEETLYYIPAPLEFRNKIQEQLWRISKEKGGPERLMDV